MNKIDIIKIGKHKKIRYYGCKSKKQLCEELEINYECPDTSYLKKIRNKPVGITLTDENEKETKFKSMYAASKFLDKNPGSIYYSLKTPGIILKTKKGTYKVSLTNLILNNT